MLLLTKLMLYVSLFYEKIFHSYFFIVSCSKESIYTLNEIMVGEIKQSLVQKHHSSEGFLVNSDGIVYHFFRQDITENSDHISNTVHPFKLSSPVGVIIL